MNYNYYIFDVLGEAGIDLKMPYAQRAPYDASKYFDYYDTLKYKYQFYEEDISLCDVHLKEGSVETDFIFGGVEIGGIGLMMSELALGIFKYFNVPPNKVYPLNVFLNKTPTSKKYYWVHFIDYDVTSYINFNLSNIVVKESNAIVPSLEKLKEFRSFNLKKRKKITYNKVTFNKCKFSFFGVSVITFKFIVAYDLKQKIEEANLTGLHPFIPVKFLK